MRIHLNQRKNIVNTLLTAVYINACILLNADKRRFHRIENPRVRGSIPRLATTAFLVKTATHPGCRFSFQQTKSACHLISDAAFSPGWFEVVHHALVAFTGGHVAKPNYQFEKRQRDLAKKSKQEEKRRQKLLAKGGEQEPGEQLAPSSESADSSSSPATAGVEG